MKEKENKHGGKRKGAGRPSKGEVLQIKNLLDEHIDEKWVMEKLHELIDSGDYRALELYLKYRIGTPVQSVQHDVRGKMQNEFKIENLVTFKKPTVQLDEYEDVTEE